MVDFLRKCRLIKISILSMSFFIKNRNPNHHLHDHWYDHWYNHSNDHRNDFIHEHSNDHRHDHTNDYRYKHSNKYRYEHSNNYRYEHSNNYRYEHFDNNNQKFNNNNYFNIINHYFAVIFLLFLLSQDKKRDLNNSFVQQCAQIYTFKFLNFPSILYLYYLFLISAEIRFRLVRKLQCISLLFNN